MPDNLPRRHLAQMLTKPNAHPMLEEIIADFPEEHYGTIPEGYSHSAWQLMEHIRLDLIDVYNYLTDPEFIPLESSDAIWPKSSSPESKNDVEQSVRGFTDWMNKFLALIEDEKNDLNKPFSRDDGPTIFQAVLLIIKHNSYHLGQIVQLKRWLERQSN